ncbi:MAG: class I SAM-dependent methyltransferase [Cyanobacteria bacterium J06631_2]
MFEEQPQSIQQKVKSMADNSLEQQDPSGWFEPLYADAAGDTAQVPWAKNQAHPYLQQWLAEYPPQTQEKSALVIACGLGDDAELLASIGYRVTAFDISPTAIAWCKQRFPDSQVDYQVADLFSLNSNWQGKFDFVFECRTIQALPLDVRSQVIGEIAPLVAPEGTLIVVTRHREPNTIPEGPPWALSSKELGKFGELGLSEVRCDRFIEGEQHKVAQLRLEYHRLETGDR